MARFLLMVGVAVALFAVVFLLYRRAPRGWTRVFLAIAWISAAAFPVCVILHNLVGGVFHVEEPVFFLLAVLGAPLGVLVGLVGAAIAAWRAGHASA